MANFSLYFFTLLQKEGGITTDTGGFTNKGITLDSWQTYGRDLNGDGRIDEADVRLISDADAASFYRKNYWDKIQGDLIKSQVVAELLFDHAVNAGVSRASKLMQWILVNQFHKSIGPSGIDGIIGKDTLAAINSVNASQLANAYKQMRIYYYNYLAGNVTSVPDPVKAFFADLSLSSSASKYGAYLNGWLNRVNSFVIENAKSIVPTLLLLGGAGFIAYSLWNKNK